MNSIQVDVVHQEQYQKKQLEDDSIDPVINVISAEDVIMGAETGNYSSGDDADFLEPELPEDEDFH